MSTPEIPGYRALRLIGRGGSSEVYAAYQDMIDRQVAIKVLADSGDAPGLISRELKTLMMLTEHANISQILDHGVLRDGRAFLVMPLYNRSLADLIAQRGALDLETVLRMGVKLCGAVDTLYKLGIVHRDIKPGNIMLNRYGEVILCDFGLAQLSGRTPDPSFGFTAVYAPPEMITDGLIGPAGDVYSLAASLYCAAVGEAPFSGSSMSYVVDDVLAGLKPRLEARDEDFAALIKQAMSRAPDTRPTALQMGTAMQTMQRVRGLPITELTLSQTELLNAEPGSTAQREVDTYLDSAKPVRDQTVLRPGAAPSPPVTITPPSSSRVRPRVTSSPHPVWPARLKHGMSVALRAGTDLWIFLTGVLRQFRRRPTPPGAPPASSSTTDMDWLGCVSADRPSAVDQLDHAPLTEGLAQVLNDPGTALPITIAACGQWGSGKSSLMLQLAERLCVGPSPEWQRRWTPVTFDAWRFQGREALWAGVARAIYKQTSRAMAPTERLRFRMRLERFRRGTMRFVLGSVVLLIGTGFVVWSATAAWLGANSWLTFAGLGAGAAALTAATTYVGALSQPFERAVGRGSVTKKFDEFLGISDQAEHDIECLLDAIVAGDDRRCIIVLLDDLDRCQAALITEALAAITEIFGRHEGRRIAFVLGVDLDVVTSAVDTSLAELRTRMQRLNARRAGEMSEQFLEKVFQLSVSVDGHRRQRVERLFVPADAELDAASLDPTTDHDVAMRVARLNVQNPSEITQARHDAGINSVLLDGQEVRALRAAVRARRSSLLSIKSGDVRDAEQIVISSLAMTPRAAKRFDNAFRLQLQVANSTPGCELTFDASSLIAMAKWVALRMFFPSIIRLIDRRPGTLGELEETLAADREPAGFHRRVRGLSPDIDEEVVADLARLLKVNLPASELAVLPLDSFATTIM